MYFVGRRHNTDHTIIFYSRESSASKMIASLLLYVEALSRLFTSVFSTIIKNPIYTTASEKMEHQLTRHLDHPYLQTREGWLFNAVNNFDYRGIFHTITIRIEIFLHSNASTNITLILSLLLPTPRVCRILPESYESAMPITTTTSCRIHRCPSRSCVVVTWRTWQSTSPTI